MLLSCKPGIPGLQATDGCAEFSRLASPTIRVGSLAAALARHQSPAWVGSAAAQSPLPYPCGVVPTADIVAALGTKLGSVAPVLSSVQNVSTCSYAGGSLSISVGTTTIANPALPLKVVHALGLPTGTYKTYSGSTQTEIVFVKGSAATGTYGVVRNYAKIKQAKLLEAIAIALYKGITSGPTGSGTSTTPVKLPANTAASLSP